MSIFVFIVLDICLYFSSVIIGYGLREFLGKVFPSLPPFIIPLNFVLSQFWIVAIFILSFFYNGLYTKIRDFWSDLEAILKSFFFSIILIFSIIAFIKYSGRLSRLHLLLSIFAFFFLYVTIRYVFKLLLNKIPWTMKNVLILGITKSSISLANFIQNNPYLSYRVLGFWDNGYKRKKLVLGNSKIKVFRIEDIEKILRKLKPDSVIISENHFSLNEFISPARKYVKNILFIPNNNPFFICNSFLFSPLYSNSFVLSFKNNLREPLNIFIKRVFDLTASLLLLLLLSPIMAIIAIIIKYDSPGPIFFTHIREGKNKREIKVFKFRTMYVNSECILQNYFSKNPGIRDEWNKYRKLKNDPRVTRIGKFLRKTSLDELPQLFNVLIGQMSLVGPRPVTKEEVDKYYGKFSSFYYEVKPGITGLWQVSGKNKLSYAQRVFLDVTYVVNWSIWRDLIVLLKTAKVIFTNEEC